MFNDTLKLKIGHCQYPGNDYHPRMFSLVFFKIIIVLKESNVKNQTPVCSVKFIWKKKIYILSMAIINNKNDLILSSVLSNNPGIINHLPVRYMF